MGADTGRVQAAVRLHLESGDLVTLFQTDLGWDAPEPIVRLTDDSATATQIAEKRGVGIWIVHGADSATASRLDHQIEQQSHERLVVVEGLEGLIWQWPEHRRSGYVRRSRLAQHTPGETTDIVQRLASLRFEPGEDKDLTVLDVRDRVRRSFNTERVTEAFFREFKACHDLIGGKAEDATVAGAISGIPSRDESRWYASVLLNRLMFLYFLQKKGFLDNDLDYLRNRLESITRTGGDFFSQFLIPLFHSAIGAREVGTLPPETQRLIGSVPYLNGGVFAVHPLEAQYQIRLANDVFRQVFSVFDAYRWHLDERDVASGEEINPDILGHIFERYVNQKDTGAFYTPDDTTGWMAAGSVGVVLLQHLTELGADIGALAAANPRRYLADEVFFGEDAVDERDRFPEPGTAEHLDWSRRAPPDVALPDETLWEVRDRLRYAHQLEEKLKGGAILGPGDAFDHNLNLLALIADAIDRLTPANLDAFWRRLMGLAVLDPTCGSGAFLLACLDLIEDVAGLVIARAYELASIAETRVHREMERTALSARRLHVRQRIVLGCLYGTDIAGEAIDIARLRLYLALVAVMFDRSDLRPLPDLEFNLVEGNLLVGVNSAAEMEKVVGGALWARNALDDLNRQLSELATSIAAFRAAQEEEGTGAGIEPAKAKARSEADALSNALDAALHKAVATGTPFETWLHSHEPLHMLAEFPEVMLRGGFDVVIGNPPYVKRSKVVSRYRFDGYETSESSDIYAPCTERALALVRPGGALAFVLPHSAVWSDEYGVLRKVLSREGTVAMASFGRNPDAIFRGVGIRNAITFVRRGSALGVHVTAMQRWTARYRPALFGTLRWHPLTPTPVDGAGWPRFGSAFAVELWDRLAAAASPIDLLADGKEQLYSKKTALYWLPISPWHLRTIGARGGEVETEKQMRLVVRDETTKYAAFAVFASKLGLVLWNAISDDFDVVQRQYAQIPVVPRDPAEVDELASIGREAADALEASPDAHLWTPYAGYWVESLDTRVAMPRFDQASRRVLEHIGLANRWDELEAWYWRTMKSTGERPGTARGLQPPTWAVKGGKRRHGTVARLG